MCRVLLIFDFSSLWIALLTLHYFEAGKINLFFTNAVIFFKKSSDFLSTNYQRLVFYDAQKIINVCHFLIPKTQSTQLVFCFVFWQLKVENSKKSVWNLNFECVNLYGLEIFSVSIILIGHFLSFEEHWTSLSNTYSSSK